MASMAGTRIITIEPRSQIAKGTRSGSRIPVWIPLRRRRDTFVMASVGGDPGVGGNVSNDNARALELKTHVNESSQEIAFKDSSTLPIQTELSSCSRSLGSSHRELLLPAVGSLLVGCSGTAVFFLLADCSNPPQPISTRALPSSPCRLNLFSLPSSSPSCGLLQSATAYLYSRLAELFSLSPQPVFFAVATCPLYSSRPA
ncbi:hypothetical protein KSP39_PZI023798 [Platanthera zijinensis]|uniref:Uncharacterized protein n=1 Tax=Platanthera zijinensis TaxID=2320716 RepID=A0AAP0ATP2_9ASPA